MGNISVALPSDGETIDAADYNTPINTIVNEINGSLDNSNLASDAAISGSKLADTSVTNAKLATGAGEPGGEWNSWTPTLSGSLNNSKWTKDAKYKKIGKTIHFQMTLTANSATPMDGGSGEAAFTLPVEAASNLGNDTSILGACKLVNPGSASLVGITGMNSTTVGFVRLLLASGTYVDDQAITSTTPFSWANGHIIFAEGTYEAA